MRGCARIRVSHLACRYKCCRGASLLQTLCMLVQTHPNKKKIIICVPIFNMGSYAARGFPVSVLMLRCGNIYTRKSMVCTPYASVCVIVKNLLRANKKATDDMFTQRNQSGVCVCVRRCLHMVWSAHMRARTPRGRWRVAS